jgi:hypothetical protein
MNALLSSKRTIRKNTQLRHVFSFKSFIGFSCNFITYICDGYIYILHQSVYFNIFLCTLMAAIL